jgi:CheY-like chemotaxis protein
MNGSIEVASQPGEGSAFALVLNLPLGPGPEPEPFPPADLQGTRVLIVDDFAINRFVFLDLCLRWGMRPDEASSGAEALRMVAAAWRDGDPYRALLLDSIMPEMDGEDVARRLRATPEGREPAIVMATSSAHQGEADRVRAAGCDGYLVKPIKSGLLQEALVRVLGARSAGVPQSLVTDNSLVKLRNCLAPAPSSAGKPFAGCRALLAEDNLINQKLGIRLLEKLGCSVDLAVNGLEAARLSANNAYDVVFMDCQMPEMDGFEATAEIRRREGAGRRTPIVAITAYAMDGDRERCLLAGMDDYIPKPIRPGVLEQALQTWFPRAQDAAQTETSRPEDDLQTLA